MRRIIRLTIVIVWVGVMAVLVHRSYAQASGTLATDLARYGSSAQWRGVYYRGEKVGFTVSQIIPAAHVEGDQDGELELHEDGQLQMSLLGAHTVTKIRTTARVSRSFELRSFKFALDPGTGPITIGGEVSDGSGEVGDGRARRKSRTTNLRVSITSAGRTRTEVIGLPERPMLALNLVRRLAETGLTTGARHQWNMFDPATLRNAPVHVTVGARELVRAANLPIPAFRVEMEFSGLRTTSWITDTGEVIREESPLGFITVRETAERAQALAVPGQIRQDLLEASAVIPEMAPQVPPISDPRDIRLIRMRVDGTDLSSADLTGVGQRVNENVVEIVDARGLAPVADDPALARYVAPEPFIESDDPDIRIAAQDAVRGVIGAGARAEALTRYVSSTLQKKPTVSLPSAREVLRTRIGDCNEHTVLFVAMARSIGLPARIAVGLTFVRGAFYYHAWPEVYISEGANHGRWLPVDPTFNQFPADLTHFRLARGGLDKQAAIIPMIGRIKITVLDLELAPGSTPVLVGQAGHGVRPFFSHEGDGLSEKRSPTPSRWCLPCFLGGHQ
jgi:transglutaminase-like putative cysteine protease